MNFEVGEACTFRALWGGLGAVGERKERREHVSEGALLQCPSLSYIRSPWGLHVCDDKGVKGACVRKRVAAVPIAVTLVIGLQSVGIHAYTHVALRR